jgi:hypothetical protein
MYATGRKRNFALNIRYGPKTNVRRVSDLGEKGALSGSRMPQFPTGARPLLKTVSFQLHFLPNQRG